MKAMKISLKELKDMISRHDDFIVNYGKGFRDEDIKELAYWDDDIKAYRGETGIWDMKLLYEIANGEVEDTSLERSDDLLKS